MKLYELTANYQNLLELIDTDAPQEVIKAALDQVGEEIDIKVENTAKVIKSIEKDVKGLKEEEDRLSARRKALENNITSLKAYIETSMRAVGKDKIKGNIFSLAIQKNAPSVDIKNLEAIPKDYIVTKIETKNKEILAALKSGISIPGAELKQTESLRIR